MDEGPSPLANDPILVALQAAEWDDEPLTEEGIAAIEEGEAASRRGDDITLEELRRQNLGDDASGSSETREPVDEQR